MTTIAERDWMNRVAELGCLICRADAELHHVREGQGMSQRASNYLVVPLCPDHHRGNNGIHSHGFYRMHKRDEMSLLAEVIERLNS